jgi:hypothetical protein
MSCRLIDLPCHLWTWIEPFWFWIQFGFWIVVALAVLWALAKLKEIGGWPAVTGALAALTYFIGHWRGRKGKPLVPDNVTDLDGPDAAPSPTIFRRRKREDPPKPGTRTRFNHDTGKFERY